MNKKHSALWWVLIGWWLYPMYYMFVWWWLTPIKHLAKHRETKNINNNPKLIKYDYDTRISETRSVSQHIQPVSTQVQYFEYSGKEADPVINDYVVIDTETTGLSRYTNEIIEFAGIRVRNGAIVDRYSSLIRPSVLISSRITQLTGITNEMVEHSPQITDVIGNIISFIGQDTVVGHNVKFDLGFLCSALGRLGYRSFSNPYIDTLSLARKEFPEFENHKLKTIITKLNFAADQDHRALSDAFHTNSLYQFLYNKYKIEKIALPRDVHPFLSIDQAHIVKENEKHVFYDVPDYCKGNAIALIMGINNYISQASALVESFDPLFFSPQDIVFESFTEKYRFYSDSDYEVEDIHPYTKIEEHVYTSLGNTKKHPFSLSYFTKRHRFFNSAGRLITDEIFGKIYVDKDANPSRYEIVHWKNGNMHRILCTKETNGQISISKIESADTVGRRFAKYQRI